MPYYYIVIRTVDAEKTIYWNSSRGIWVCDPRKASLYSEKASLEVTQSDFGVKFNLGRINVHECAIRE